MAIFDELKSVGKVLQEAGKIEQYKQILEAQEKLLEMQKKIQELENENMELRGSLKIKENLIFEKGMYWILEDNKKDGPFCSVCYDDKKKLIRLHAGMNERSFCKACRNYF
jgi:hypothetical protein